MMVEEPNEVTFHTDGSLFREQTPVVMENILYYYLLCASDGVEFDSSMYVMDSHRMEYDSIKNYLSGYVSDNFEFALNVNYVIEHIEITSSGNVLSRWVRNG